MSAFISNAKGGEFATSRHGAIDYSDFEKIRALWANAVSAQTIAFVMGRPVCDILPVVACFPKGMREPYRPPIEPKPPVSFTEGGRAGLGPFLTVAKAVAKKSCVSVADLRGPARTKTIAHARHEAFWILRQTTSISLPHIGQWFGSRHHTTVLHGVRAHAQRMEGGVG